jgi:hypothetical protein
MVRRGTKYDNLSIFFASGLLTPDELIAAYTDFLGTAPTPLVLWNLSLASLAGMRSEDLRAVAKRAVELASNRPPGRSAFMVGPRDAEYGLARMLSNFLSFEKYPAEVEAFRDRSKAEVWLFESQR